MAQLATQVTLTIAVPQRVVEGRCDRRRLRGNGDDARGADGCVAAPFEQRHQQLGQVGMGDMHRAQRELDALLRLCGPPVRPTGAEPRIEDQSIEARVAAAHRASEGVHSVQIRQIERRGHDAGITNARTVVGVALRAGERCRADDGGGLVAPRERAARQQHCRVAGDELAGEFQTESRIGAGDQVCASRR